MDIAKISIREVTKNIICRIPATVVFVFCFLLPLLLYLNKFLYPDMSFDTINYHLYLPWELFSQRKNENFFPTGLQNFSAFLDLGGYFFRSLFGYRIGTVFNLLCYFLIIFVLVKIIHVLNPKISFFKSLFSSCFLFYISSSFEAYAQLSTYYNDIPSALVVLFAIYFLLKYLKTRKDMDIFISSFVFGLSFLGKNTNIIFVIPFVLLLIYLFLAKEISFVKFISLLFIFILPSSYFLGHNLFLTGNPVFPFYNGFFRSEYAYPGNFENADFGGITFVDKLFWPIISLITYPRLSELSRFYLDSRLGIFFILLISGLLMIFRKKIVNKGLILSTFFVLLATIVWSFLFGYLRYAIALEFFSGCLALVILNEITIGVRRSLFFLLCICLIILNAKKTIASSLIYDWSWRSSFYESSEKYVLEEKYLLYNLISTRQVKKASNSIYLNCSLPSLGYLTLSDLGHVQIYNIDRKSYGELTSSNKYMLQQKDEIVKQQNSHFVSFYTMVSPQNLDDCVANIKYYKGQIEDSDEISDFLGYKNMRIILLKGKIKL